MDNLIKLKQNITDKSGRSMVYVIGVMFFIMIICASIAAAALNSIGSEIKQHDYYQIKLLDESVHKNIMYSLQTGESNTNMLGYQFVKALYDAGGSLGDFELGVSIDTTNINSGDYRIENVRVSFPWQRVVIYEQIPTTYISRQEVVFVYFDEFGEEIEVPDYFDVSGNKVSKSRIFDDFGYVKDTAPEEVYDSYGNPPQDIPNVLISENRVEYSDELISKRIPKTANISASMEVTVKINAKGKIVTSRAVYEYINGVLVDDPEGRFAEEKEENIRPEDISDMLFPKDEHGNTYGYGDWRLSKYEIINS